MKTCSRCAVAKPLTEFYKKSGRKYRRVTDPLWWLSPANPTNQGI